MQKLYLIYFIISLLIPSVCFSSDYFDWDVRTDRDGKAAGIYSTTPFPITESSTSYTITNDEGNKTFYLGTKYYVDGGGGSDSNGGTSLVDAKETISAAISTAGSGNKTIIVRGAHDAFDGIYQEGSSLNPNYGTDDTHRFMIVGYGQERPIIDGENGTFDVVETLKSSANSYVTIQRVKIQNSKRNGFYAGTWTPSKTDAYTYLIDAWVYNCDNDASYAGSADGNIYFMGVDHGLITHCTVERTYGHGIKYADDGDNAVIEWTVINECRYWSGISDPSGVDNDAFGLHISNVSGHLGENHKIRYNIVYDIGWFCLQLRRTPNFSVHHNEFYGGAKIYSFTASPNNNTPTTVYLVYEDTDGDFYSNIIRDSETTNAAIELMRVRLNTSSTINFYRNLFYGWDSSAVHIRNDNTSSDFNFYNNTFYGAGDYAFDDDMGSGVTSLTNNIIYQTSTGACVSGAPAHTYNLYYAPSGSVGVTLSTGEANDNPDFDSVPSGAYSEGEAYLTDVSPAIDTGTDVGLSYDGEGPDMGAFEYTSGDVTPPTVSSASVDETSTTIVCSEDVVITLLDDGDFKMTGTTTGEVNLTSCTEPSAGTISCTAASSFIPGETVTLAYSGGADEVEDTSGNDMETFSGAAVANNTVNFSFSGGASFNTNSGSTFTVTN